jgi:uncharacterized protein (TIGR00661 family)
VVITDFEPITAYLANHYDLPLITLDNQHRMRYMEYEVPPGGDAGAAMTKTITRLMIPRPDVSLVITFFTGTVRNARTFLFPPLIRQEVLNAQPSDGGHILIYVTSGFDPLLNILKTFPREVFHVYGYDKEEIDGALHYKPFSRDGFLHDLASAKAVIATAGFTLISEAIHLRKPYLASPMQGQYEQELNAFQLQNLGYGAGLLKPTREAVAAFLYDLPAYQHALSQRPEMDQSAIKQKLDELLADDGRLARQFHEARKAE